MRSSLRVILLFCALVAVGACSAGESMVGRGRGGDSGAAAGEGSGATGASAGTGANGGSGGSGALAGSGAVGGSGGSSVGGSGASAGAGGSSGSGGVSGAGGGGSGGTAGTAGSGGSGGSAGAGGSGGISECDPVPSCPSGGTISGTVFAPNGVDPLPHALVYVPKGSNNDFPEGLSCCDEAFAACRHITAQADGTFTLTGVRPGMTELDIQIGRFRRRLNVDVPCGTLMLTPEQSRLPKNTSEGDLPKIAVATGLYDSLECVLRKIGLEDSALDILDNIDQDSPFSDLLKDFAKLSQYHMVLVSCGDEDDYISDAQVRKNLDDYAKQGGRLYMTDLSYSHIEQVEAFAPNICWGGSTTCPATPEDWGAAMDGKAGITIDATVKDNTLKNWLALLGATNPDGTVHLEHFDTQWAYMKSTVQPPVKEWVEGVATNMADQSTGVIPLTVTFSHNDCGRVFYSSYHTSGNACGSGALTPQEHILEYFLFAITRCLN